MFRKLIAAIHTVARWSILGAISIDAMELERLRPLALGLYALSAVADHIERD
jgi:hypothetical protein